MKDTIIKLPLRN